MLGKSTFLDLLTGRTKPDSGWLYFNEDVDLTRLNEYQISRLGIGRKFQTPSVYTEHTVFDNLLLSIEGKRSVWSSIIHQLSSTEEDKIHEILKTTKLEERKDWKAGSLSHGQKQWLEIGMLLAQDPDLMLVDEPAAGMSDEETARTGDLLLELSGKHSIIVIEHDMEFVKQLNSPVTVLHQGSVLCEGTMDEVQSDERVVEVYLGRKHERKEVA